MRLSPNFLIIKKRNAHYKDTGYKKMKSRIRTMPVPMNHIISLIRGIYWLEWMEIFTVVIGKVPNLYLINGYTN